jgi:hypothetical protein
MQIIPLGPSDVPGEGDSAVDVNAGVLDIPASLAGNQEQDW